MARIFAKSALALAGMATAMIPLAAEARPGWGGGDRHWHRDRGIDGGDVLAGLLIFGGIAAIASAASKSNDRRDDNYRYRPEPAPNDTYRQDDWRPNETRPYEGQGTSPRAATRGIDDAVERCVDEASRKGDVEEIYDATRAGNGYRVSGTLRNGDRFSCDVNGEGGILLDLRRSNF
ncbi:hypothetical protein [Novosphingobium sp. MMS21-SN21R]|uniref:hypothetical protein n=1 Tax=Novosphingobium sp. MMS21-SN21R TaxID=2969298 RepID=UPI0028859F7A|nr:hypothetical protein [Novosphingobium sp. MMS21-SN21R]MDT0508617.1 hypothetical protein [Novosphingobium sp. MMS21-SN21R]